MRIRLSESIAQIWRPAVTRFSNLAGDELPYAATFFRIARRRKNRLISRLRPFRFTSLISLTSFAPPLAAFKHDLAAVERFELRPMADADERRSVPAAWLRSSISLSWLSGSSAAVASSSTMMSGLCRKMRANARRCFSPPESVWSHGASSSMRSTRWSSPTRLKRLRDFLDGPALRRRRDRSRPGAACRSEYRAAAAAAYSFAPLLHLDHCLRPTARARRSRAPACSCRCRIRPRSAPARRA